MNDDSKYGWVGPVIGAILIALYVANVWTLAAKERCAYGVSVRALGIIAPPAGMVLGAVPMLCEEE